MSIASSAPPPPPPQKKEPDYEPGHDLRLDFVYGYVTRAFRIKPDKWNKFIKIEDNKTLLYDFFENPENMILLINLSPEGVLLPMTGFPPEVTTKSIYMIKKIPAAFAPDDYAGFKECLIVGDLPPAPLEALITFIEEILRPVIVSEVNQDKWPEIVVSDLKQQTQDICSVLYTVQGQLKGKTLLPMPMNLEQMEENERRLDEGGPSEVDLQLKTSLETLVIKWSQQINEVLQEDSSKPLKAGLNPTPYVEVSFWEDRVQDLQCIHSQLNDDKVRRLANLLEKTDSTYWPCFKTMFRNVVAALAEAEDILAHLKPLCRYLDNVLLASFEEMAEHLEPLMNSICLVWGYSKYYCSPARIIVLLQEVCNMLIEAARGYIDGFTIFQCQPLEGQAKAQLVVNTIQLFRNLYDANKGELPVYFNEASEAKNWDFLPHLVFERYDKFLDRMKRLKKYFDTSVELYKLKSMDFGGTRGKYLSAYVADLYAEFMEFYQMHSEIQYDCSDPDDDNFDEEYKVFEEKIEEIDKRLSAIFVKALETSDTPETLHKLIQTLGPLLEIPIIKQDFEQKYHVYVTMLDQELGALKEMYDKIISPFPITERSEIYAQYPPYSATIYWARGMKERFQQNMENFKSLNLVVEDKESVELLNDKFTELSEILDKTQEDAYKEWQDTVNSEADGWLKEFIFKTNPEDGSFIVNFRSELYGTIKEVQYMKNAGYTDIPGTATKLYEDREVFRKNLVSLDQVAHSYKILRNANAAEREVLKTKLTEIDKVLKDGKERIKWSDSGSSIWDYVEKLRTPIADVLEKFQNSLDNISALKKLVLGWLARPLFERKNGETDQLLDLGETATARKNAQYKEIEEMSVKVHQLVAKNKELLFDSNTTDAAWKGYLTYIDGIVKDALVKTATVSVGYLADHTDPGLTPGPFLEVVMDLDDNGINYFPSFDFAHNNSIRNLVDDILQDIFRQGSLVKRVRPGNDDYLTDMESAQSITEMQNDIIERVQAVTEQALEFCTRFDVYSNLWDDDKKEYMSQFLKYGRQLSQEEVDAKFAGVEIPEKKPTLEQFHEVIGKYEKLYQEVEKFVQEMVFDKWLRLDMRPFRQSLLNQCKRWSLMFKQFLIDSAVGGLQDLDEFIREARKGLSQPLKEGDTKTLISVMRWLQQMKERQVTTDTMFEPIKQYLELLKMYEYEPPDAVYVQLDELPQKWTNMKKLAIQVKHQAAPLQAKEVSSIRKRIADFDKRQQEFRKKFKECGIFEREHQTPYVTIDTMHVEIVALEKEFEEICTQADLFEVLVPEPKSLRLCPSELKFAKTIWDCIYIASSYVEDWKRTPWGNINFDLFNTESKRLDKDAKAMDKDVKHWEIYLTLEVLIKNMIPVREVEPDEDL